MDGGMGKKLELLLLTRQEEYQELSNKINQVNKQLGARMDSSGISGIYVHHEFNSFIRRNI